MDLRAVFYDCTGDYSTEYWALKYEIKYQHGSLADIVAQAIARNITGIQDIFVHILHLKPLTLIHWFDPNLKAEFAFARTNCIFLPVPVGSIPVYSPRNNQVANCP